MRCNICKTFRRVWRVLRANIMMLVFITVSFLLLLVVSLHQLHGVFKALTMGLMEGRVPFSEGGSEQSWASGRSSALKDF